jgi:predicted alpha-1,6-mannanase (GH76 family)
LLNKLYENAAYYKGTFTLTSYTQTKKWSVYGVDRGGSKGLAFVEGIHNVYDDQQWLVRELIEAYKLTKNSTYLAEAEYLTDYVLDGWDCVPDANGKEYGGITWGPGYVTKHSCSNGPMVSPLVWLSELYKDKDDQITYRYIGTDGSRITTSMKKSDYYLKFAKAVYDWQKNNLMRSDGVYYDMMGGCDPVCDVIYETVNGVQYRKHVDLRDKVGTAYSYNTGTMLSGAADLYRATGISTYLDDASKLTKASFGYFAKKDATVNGYYSYDLSGFNNWFNGVLMRGYVDVYPIFKSASVCIGSFQQNLDYGYEKFLYKGFLPTNLLLGWSHDNNNNSMEGMFTFTFAAEYATLARYEIEK